VKEVLRIIRSVLQILKKSTVDTSLRTTLMSWIIIMQHFCNRMKST